VSTGQNAALLLWLRYCEQHPSKWAAGQVEIPLGQVGMTLDEVQRMFGRPTLAEVREAVLLILAATGSCQICGADDWDASYDPWSHVTSWTCKGCKFITAANPAPGL
jgi:hypothetical protein